MIRLTKGAEPQILVDRGVEWREEFLAARSTPGAMTDTIRYRYRHQDIKAALRAECCNKCIYCEVKVAFGETDHIEPVDHVPEKIVEWSNLGLACKECNTFKSSYHSPTEPLINPFTDEPGAHLDVLGPAVFHKPNDLKGYRTVEQLRLQRTDLLQRRAERLRRVIPLIEKWQSLPDSPTRDLYKSEILREAGAEGEFAAVIRAYIWHVLGWKV